MLDSLTVLHDQWRAAEEASASAERALMDTMRQGIATPAQIEHVKTRRREASRLLREFLAATQSAANACAARGSATRSVHN